MSTQLFVNPTFKYYTAATYSIVQLHPLEAKKNRTISNYLYYHKNLEYIFFFLQTWITGRFLFSAYMNHRTQSLTIQLEVSWQEARYGLSHTTFLLQFPGTPTFRQQWSRNLPCAVQPQYSILLLCSWASI